MSNEDLRELYRELILDHSRHPRHFGKLEGCTHQAEGINPLCGDKLHLYLSIEGDTIEDIAFEGTGCAISVASASLMTDAILGLHVKDAEQTFSVITHRLTQPDGDDSADIDEKFKALDGVRDFPARVKCATLAWHALQAALSGHNQPATTE
ncbi:MAG: Fe-S cluster assembly sulfur transfer protein SufU [Pseudomonadota bacterium]